MKNTNLPSASSTLAAGKVIVRGIHLELTSALRERAHDVAERLLRHNDTLVRVRLDITIITIQCGARAVLGRKQPSGSSSADMF